MNGLHVFISPMVKNQIKALVRDATASAEMNPGHHIGHPVAGIFNAILEEINQQAQSDPALKDNLVLKSIKPVTGERTRWEELRALISQLDIMPVS